ncbi:phage tail protein [Flexibacterium corallicola]|uniref:phage tail protein n=1 Tax=Flexibacterium corallicola TaxID=3037259 RepID=UPI00286FA0AF|nr:tail fiber protein [Pseudovibrio sp. M1P-2-3]
MADPFISQVSMFGLNFAIRGYGVCSGALLSIASQQTLFSLIGTTYGGDGRTSFGLPELRGRFPVGPTTRASPPTGFQYILGQRAGNETVTLIEQNLPPHTHTNVFPAASSLVGDSVPSANAVLSVPVVGTTSGDGFTPTSTSGVALSTSGNTMSTEGGGQPLPIMERYLAITYEIAMLGTYPQRA